MPLHGRPESLFTYARYSRDPLYAKIGTVHSAAAMPVPTFLAFIASQIETQLVHYDPELRLWCVSVKGDGNDELNVATGHYDWEHA